MKLYNVIIILFLLFVCGGLACAEQGIGESEIAASENTI